MVAGIELKKDTWRRREEREGEELDGGVDYKGGGTGAEVAEEGGEAEGDRDREGHRVKDLED